MQSHCETAARTLQTWCLTHDIPFPDDALARTACYLDRLLHYQKQTNLTGFSTPEDIVRNLCIDSLQILRTAQIRGPLLDVGTGAGFPAIPIKIIHPDMEMILVEPRTKRYAFLRLVERELGLENIRIYKSKIESVPIPAALGTAISKAFMPLPDWAKYALPWAQNGARIACLVSRADWQAFAPEILGMGYAITGCIESGEHAYLVLAYSRTQA
ncbi:MAG: 16S rRNA (guanine(527)-N(7))-methyltransferase RsmG [Proteobacteria bacterium]|nr:16S rRNA (guanine(527)-N(7))-methyltransferase RsmG [Pseudomonadota bacterium]